VQLLGAILLSNREREDEVTERVLIYHEVKIMALELRYNPREERERERERDKYI
jgi:hypothetical protein